MLMSFGSKLLEENVTSHSARTLLFSLFLVIPTTGIYRILAKVIEPETSGRCFWFSLSAPVWPCSFLSQAEGFGKQRAKKARHASRFSRKAACRSKCRGFPSPGSGELWMPAVVHMTRAQRGTCIRYNSKRDRAKRCSQTVVKRCQELTRKMRHA